MKITIEVVGGKRFHPGVAHVKVDGELVAKLRCDESYELDVKTDYVSSFKVKPEPAPIEGNGRQGCEWCEGDPTLCDGQECEK